MIELLKRYDWRIMKVLQLKGRNEGAGDAIKVI